MKVAQAKPSMPPWRSKPLRAYSVAELLRLKRALEGSEGMIVDGRIYKSVLDTIWTRASVPATEWPVSLWPSSTLRVVRFCHGASDGWTKDKTGKSVRGGDCLGPDDPKHQPARRLRPRGRVASSQTLCDFAGAWASEWYECSCGIRDGNALSGRSATGRTWRAEGELGGWLRSDEGEGADLQLKVKVPCWFVCRHAHGLDDRQHAHAAAYHGNKPGQTHFSCICGSSSYEVTRIPVGSAK